MTLICGIDDSGRGPVIGPMVLAGVLIEDKDEEKLKKLGVKDSKLLHPKTREELDDKIKKLVKAYKIFSINPKEIDEKMSSGINLNTIEAVKAAEIINFLKPDVAILDCPSPNTRAWKNEVFELLKNKNVNLIVEHKADFNYYVVGAASVIAKNFREKEIAKIKKFVGEDFRSGYSHDPITIEFLKANIDKYPEIFRKSWSTFNNHKNAKKQKKLDDF